MPNVGRRGLTHRRCTMAVSRREWSNAGMDEGHIYELSAARVPTESGGVYGTPRHNGHDEVGRGRIGG